MKGSLVRPKKWTDVIDLYDDGINSLIYGFYESLDNYHVGIRWNGKSNKDTGYPRQGKYPTWFVLPNWMAKLILSSIKNNPSGFENLDNIAETLNKLN